MNDGEISGNMAWGTKTISGSGTGATGGGVYVARFGSLVLKNGIISGNTARKDAGGVYLAGGTATQTPGSLTMTGGSITNNTVEFDSARTGGAVWVGALCDFVMTGGSISGNSAGSGFTRADYGGDGIFMNATSSRFTLGGGAVIADGVWLKSNSGDTSTISLRSPFPVAGPVTTIEMLPGTGGSDSDWAEQCWVNKPVLHWEEGADSGPLPVDRFSLGNFRNTTENTPAGTRYAINAATGLIKAGNITVTGITFSAANFGAGNPEITAFDQGITWTIFAAKVAGEGFPTQDVDWSLTGSYAPGTGITVLGGTQDSYKRCGVLTIATNETAPTITIRATSREPGYTHIYGETTISVIPAPATGQMYTWYVDTANGNDDNHGRTAASPLKTEARALAWSDIIMSAV